jgi:hypothetical protein
MPSAKDIQVLTLASGMARIKTAIPIIENLDVVLLSAINLGNSTPFQFAY